eukprot:7275384-Pyramimonas_sp.AAC.2
MYTLQQPLVGWGVHGRPVRGRGHHSSSRNKLARVVPKANAEYSHYVTTYKQNGWLHIPSFLDHVTTNALLGEAFPLLHNQMTFFPSRDSHN